MITYSDLKKLARTRLKEAQVLHDNKLYDGSVYISGYVVELSLKAKICKHLRIDQYLDSGSMSKMFATHDFDRLLLLAGLSKEINISNTVNTNLYQNWLLLTQGFPTNRYNPIGTATEQNSKDKLEALLETQWGFFTWIKRKW